MIESFRRGQAVLGVVDDAALEECHAHRIEIVDCSESF